MSKLKVNVALPFHAPHLVCFYFFFSHVCLLLFFAVKLRDPIDSSSHCSVCEINLLLSLNTAPTHPAKKENLYVFIKLFCPFSDDDDCSYGDRCHPAATCTDLIGGYNCSCPDTMIGDGYNFCGMYERFLSDCVYE